MTHLIRQNSSDLVALTAKQQRAIPLILAAKTIEEGCKSAKITKQTFYGWLKNLSFKNEFEQQRKEIVELALHELKVSAGEAVEVLRNLLNAESEQVRLRTAIGLLDHILKSIELDDLTDRVERLERATPDRR